MTKKMRPAFVRAGKRGGQRASSGIGLRLRPGERVMRYLLEEVDRSRRNGDQRLPTVREVAAQLNVSRFTVHSAFQKLVGQGCIRSKVGNGTFLVAPQPIKGRPAPTDCLRIALNTPYPGKKPGSAWGFAIIEGMFKAAAASSPRVMVLPLPHPSPYREAAVQELIEQRSLVDGIILFPEEWDKPIRAAYEEAGKPVVDITPARMSATTNFVSMDFFEVSRRLGQVWRETGRKRVALVADQPTNVSIQLYYFGLQAGLNRELHPDISLQYLLPNSILEEDGYQAINSVLAVSRTAFDAVYCIGDPLALGVVRALRAHGLRVPEDVSVVGGTGMDLSISACPRLTRIGQPMEAIGEAAIDMLRQRIQQHGASAPGRVLPINFIGGATTRREENDLLGIIE